MAIVDNLEESAVTVKKGELLSAMRENLTQHRESFLKAQVGYREAVIKELDRMLADAREGKRIVRAIALPEPQEHSKDYERVIRMLEMSTADEIKISAQQFAQYVLDDWGWKAAFSTTNATYGA